MVLLEDSWLASTQVLKVLIFERACVHELILKKKKSAYIAPQECIKTVIAALFVIAKKSGSLNINFNIQRKI